MSSLNKVGWENIKTGDHGINIKNNLQRRAIFFILIKKLYPNIEIWENQKLIMFNTDKYVTLWFNTDNDMIRYEILSLLDILKLRL